MKHVSRPTFIFLHIVAATLLLVNCAFLDLSEPFDITVVDDDIKISEVMTSNSSTFYDQFGETPDWIELYNSGDSAIDLAGYTLTDNPDQPEKWTCGSIVIAKIESMAAAIQSEIPRDFARWEKPVSQWEQSVTGLKNWAKYRPAGMRKNYMEFFSLAEQQASRLPSRAGAA